jgi:hypothetical protein
MVGIWVVLGLLLVTPAQAADELAKADRLFAQGGLENLRQSIAITLTAVEQNPGSFEKAYTIDKSYKQGGPMLSLGRFWSVLPWLLRDRQKGLNYFREYQKAGYFGSNVEAHLFLSELLIQTGGDADKAEAKGYLEKAALSPDPYFRNWAVRLLAEIGQ